MSDRSTAYGSGALMALLSVLHASVGGLTQATDTMGQTGTPVLLEPFYVLVDALSYGTKTIPQTGAFADIHRQFTSVLADYRAVLDSLTSGDIHTMRGAAASFNESRNLLMVAAERLAGRELGDKGFSEFG